MVPATTRLARTKTAIVLTAAGGVVLAAALLGAQRARPAQPPEPEPVVDVGGISLGARATSSAILRGTSETHLAITIRTPDIEHRARPPIALSIVLDRSGSMSQPGNKIVQAKAAANHMIDELGPDDRFSVVTFSTEAEVLVPLTIASTEAKARARAAISTVYADGNTDISDALDLGATSLGATAGDDGLRRVVLISDGRPKGGGIVDPDALAGFAHEIADRGISITAVGVGLDFDERLMTEISVQGRGNYYFVEDTAQLAMMFDHELDSLGQTVAAEAQLAITPAPGVEVLEAYGYRAVGVGNDTLVPIADLRAGETRKVVIRLRVTTGAATSMDLAQIKLSFRPRDEHQRRTATTFARAEITDDTGIVAANMDKDAVRQIEQARTAHALEEATAAYEQGDEQKAQVILKQRKSEAAAAATATGDNALRIQIDDVTTKTSAGFAAAPAPAADSGRRASKSVRLDAYDLAR